MGLVESSTHSKHEQGRMGVGLICWPWGDVALGVEGPVYVSNTFSATCIMYVTGDPALPPLADVHAECRECGAERRMERMGRNHRIITWYNPVSRREVIEG